MTDKDPVETTTAQDGSQWLTVTCRASELGRWLSHYGVAWKQHGLPLLDHVEIEASQSKAGFDRTGRSSEVYYYTLVFYKASPRS